MCIAEIHYHKKIQIDLSKIDRVINDLVILLVKKNLVILSKSFGMVQIGYIPILVAIGPSVQIIDADNAIELRLNIPFILSNFNLQKFCLSLKWPPIPGPWR